MKPFKTFQIYNLQNDLQKAKVQDILFSLGYQWQYGGQKEIIKEKDYYYRCISNKDKSFVAGCVLQFPSIEYEKYDLKIDAKKFIDIYVFENAMNKDQSDPMLEKRKKIFKVLYDFLDNNVQTRETVNKVVDKILKIIK